MLELKHIVKNYECGGTAVRALDGIDLSFRRSEFVSILGPSGCGKTTLLNIIGGLDQYTDGDLVIDGVSTKLYKDHDWDMYRNHSIGFVFQNYNLIPHQTVLANVELALTLSGVSKAERRRRAVEALEKVGLGDQIKKKPNQMSGGQMQRVAIARALVNDPEILLADEPTGALDTATSVQVMDLLREISKDRLVIMVTHNPDLAESYSTRIVRLLDGRLVDDTHPVTEEERKEEEAASRTKVKADKKEKKKAHKTRSMSLFTAASLSLNNLLTKKTRTFLTSFAGSIGIIGIALILSLSNGIQNYIDKVQEDTLSTYPISLMRLTQDYAALFGAMTESGEASQEHRESEGTVYVDDSMANMMAAMSSTTENDLRTFKAYLEAHMDEIAEYITDVQYTYDFDLQIYSGDGKTRINPTTIFDHMDESFSSMIAMMQQYATVDTMMSQFNVFSEMLDNEELLKEQYDLVAGTWSEGAQEVLLVVNENNSITNMEAYILGLEDQETIADAMDAVMSGESFTSAKTSYTYEEFLGMTFYIVPNSDFYKDSGLRYTVDGQAYTIWTDVRNAADYDQVSYVQEYGIPVTISGIIRPAPGAAASSITGTIAYRSALSKLVIDRVMESEIARQQRDETPAYDVFTGMPFETKQFSKDAPAEFLAVLDNTSMTTLVGYIATQSGIDPSMVTEEMLLGFFSALTEEEFAAMVNMFLPDTGASYETNLALIGSVDEDSPASINIYAKDFNSKELLEEFIADYNEQAADAQKIQYTDMIGIFLSGITTIIDVISYVLIAFVSISLVVSSIMIGIITYISVLERIKEIGILRAIGASKRDISRVFNAETLIVGLTAGIIGILFTVLLCLPINAIIHHLSGITSVNAVLPWVGGLILVVLSMLLTFIAGLVPARIAAKKDPVVALRSE